MPPQPENTFTRDERLQQVVLAYLKAVDAGQAPDQHKVLARHPDLATELKAFFSGQVQVQAGMAPLQGTLEPESSRLLAKRFFGDYELLKVIAQGGMGIVYLARQLSLNRIVAVKMIRAGQLASAEDVRRFRSEAENAATLDHPFIVPIYEVGELDGQHYFTMKRIQGGSLANHLRLFAKSPRDSARLVAKIARAVHHAHQRGILHRDLKPANILLDVRGKPHVTDFGLAKRVEGDAGLTQTGAILGTPSYMAPEQAAGMKALTTAVDVYGLGAILYELLTGRPPFHAGSIVETIRQVIEKEPERPRTWNRRLDRDLETVCLKCLEKDTGKRYESAEALAQDLDHWLADEPIEGRRSSALERSLKWVRRNPVVAASLGVSAMGLIGMIVFMAVSWSNAESRAAAVRELGIVQQRLAEGEEHLRDLEDRIEQKQLEVRQLDQSVRQAQVVTRWAMCFRDMQLAHVALENEHIERAIRLLGNHLPKVEQEDVRGFEWHYLWRLCHNERFLLRGHKELVALVSFADDGKTLFTLDNVGSLKLWNPWSGEEMHPPESLSGTVHALAISPDGKTIARGYEDGTVRLLDWPARKEKIVLKLQTTAVKALLFSPDGKLLASAGSNGFGRVWDIEAGKERVSLHGHKIAEFLTFAPNGRILTTWSAGPTVQLWDLAGGQGKPRTLTAQAGAWITRTAFSPDGKTLATAEAHPWDPQNGGWIVLRHPITGEKQDSIDIPGGGAFAVIYSPDGKRLAAGYSSLGIVKIWDLPLGVDKRPRNIFYGDFSRVYTMAFSPDGQLLATGSIDKSVRIWDTNSQQPVTTLREHGGRVNFLAFTSNGKRVATSDDRGTIRLWDSLTGQMTGIFAHPGPVSVAFAPNGKTMVSASLDGTAKLWDAVSGQEVLTFPGRAGPIHSVAFAPDGHTVALGRVSGVVEFWDPETGQEKFPPLQCHPAWGVVLRSPGVYLAFSADGKTLATCGNETKIKLWNLASRKERVLPSSSYCGCPAFSADGTMLACANWDGAINLWDVASGKELHVFKGHTGHVSAVAFTPDGKTLASASDDSTVKLWDVAMKQERFTLKGHTQGVICLAFAPDGKMLATGSSDGTAKLWNARVKD